MVLWHPVALIKHIARCLVDKLECAWQFPLQKAPTKMMAVTLFEMSTCTQQVTALSSGESEFYGVFLGSACASQVRQLLLEMDFKMEVEGGGAGGQFGSARTASTVRKRARETSQERTWAEELHVGTVDTTLNSAGLGTKFHPRRRLDELLMMVLLRIGVGLMPSPGAEEHRTELDKVFLSLKWISDGMGGGARLRLHAQTLCGGLVLLATVFFLVLFLGKRCVACTAEVSRRVRTSCP